jgi:hypothetical protein
VTTEVNGFFPSPLAHTRSPSAVVKVPAPSQFASAGRWLRLSRAMAQPSVPFLPFSPPKSNLSSKGLPFFSS